MIVSASQVNNDLGVKVPADLLKIVDRLDEEAGVKLREKMRLLNPSIVINQVRSPLDIDVGKAVCSVCRRYFGVGARYAGYIDFDNTVWKAVRSKKAAVVEFPRSMLCSRMAKLTDSLLGETKGVYP